MSYEDGSIHLEDAALTTTAIADYLLEVGPSILDDANTGKLRAATEAFRAAVPPDTDLDQRILLAAEELATKEGISLPEALKELVLAGMIVTKEERGE